MNSRWIGLLVSRVECSGTPRCPEYDKTFGVPFLKGTKESREKGNAVLHMRRSTPGKRRLPGPTASIGAKPLPRIAMVNTCYLAPQTTALTLQFGSSSMKALSFCISEGKGLSPRQNPQSGQLSIFSRYFSFDYHDPIGVYHQCRTVRKSKNQSSKRCRLSCICRCCSPSETINKHWLPQLGNEKRLQGVDV